MISEQFHIVPILHAGDLASGVDGDSINMKNYEKATFVFTFDALSGADAALAIYSGATDGAKTSQLYFNYAFAGAAIPNASCDVLNAWTNANTLTIAHATYDNFMLVVEVDAAEMDTENDEEWLTVVFTGTSSVVGTVDCIAILKPRYAGNRGETALA